MPDNDSLSPKLISSYVKLTVSKDRLLAYVDFIDPPSLDEGIHFTGEDLLHFLENEGIQQGLITEKSADQLLETWHGKMAKVAVAKGVPSTPPVDESIELLFATETKAMPQERADGSVDYRELGILKMVNANAALAKKNPGKPGTPGKDVYGNEVPPRVPKTVVMPTGKNTSLTPDGMLLLADISGQIVYENTRRISVSPVYHVKENVDFSTGNIDFNGSVVVHGNVNAGFRVAAEGNIEIMGIVEAADLEAHGNIVVRGGIQGIATTRIIAGYDIHALYLQNAVVTAGGNVVVADSIMNSVVMAQEVRVAGKRGLLIGGLIRVKTHLFARMIGSRMGAKTRIEFKYLKELEERILTLEAEMEQSRQKIAKVEEFLQRINRLMLLNKKLTEEQKANVESMRATLEFEKEALNEINQNYQAALKERDELPPPTVEIGTLAFPGLTITTGDETFQVNEILRTGKIVYDKTGLHKVDGQ